jgi:protein phosphatase
MGYVNVFGQTDKGRRRTNNEDAWLAAGHLRLAVLADGMGGEACGEVASALTVHTVEAVVSGAPAGVPSLNVLREAVHSANQRVIDEARFKPTCAGMGSTVVAARWDGSLLSIVSVGDSRAYLFRHGTLTQLTYDQNLGNELRDSMGWSDEQISKFPQRHVLTAAVGAGPGVIIRDAVLDMVDRDRILLCSDGLYGPAGDAAIAQLLAASASPEETASHLIEAANQAGGPDNITVILLEYRD